MVLGFPGITATALISSRLVVFVGLLSTVTACMLLSLFSRIGTGRPLTSLRRFAQSAWKPGQSSRFGGWRQYPHRCRHESIRGSRSGRASAGLSGISPGLRTRDGFHPRNGENLGQAARDFRSGLPQRGAISRAGWQLGGKTVAVEVVKFLQRLDEQKIDRKPHRPAPI